MGHLTWGTESEREFIRGLGGFRLRGPSMPRKALLEGYIAGAQLRTNWAGMDKEILIGLAKSELVKCGS